MGFIIILDDAKIDKYNSLKPMTSFYFSVEKPKIRNRTFNHQSCSSPVVKIRR